MSLPLEVGIDRLERVDRDRIDAIVGATVPSVAPTLALTVWHRGSPLLELRAGWMDPGTRHVPTRADAVFDLASITKTLTSTLFLRLVSADRVGLDDRVVTVIPELEEGGPRPLDGGQEPLSRVHLPAPPERAGWTVDVTEVTFRHLLTHTSGLAPWRSVFEASGPVPPEPGAADAVSPEERHAAGIRSVLRYPFVDRPGRAFHYSDLGLMLLGEAVRRLEGSSLESLVRSGLGPAIGLQSLGYRPLDAGIARARIVPTSVDELWRGRRCWGEVEDENCAGMGGIAGHAGVFASAADVARFGQAWLGRDRRLGVGSTVMDEAVSDQTGTRLGASRGLGWQRRSERSNDEDEGHLTPLAPSAFGHTGFTGTSLAIDPERQLVVALLTNRVYASRTHEGIEALRGEVTTALARAAGAGGRSAADPPRGGVAGVG